MSNKDKKSLIIDSIVERFKHSSNIIVLGYLLTIQFVEQLATKQKLAIEIPICTTVWSGRILLSVE